MTEKTIRTMVHTGQKPTEEQLCEIRSAASRPVIPDEDTPELTTEQYAEMASIARARRKDKGQSVKSRSR